jgi:hypothetical protein
MSSFAANSHSSRSNYPRGFFPYQAQQGAVIKPCFHCGNKLGLKRWDNWNGFLVECPNCLGLHGKRWNIKYVLMAGFMFNAISFLFTMRLRIAIPLLLGFIIVGFGGNYLLDHYEIPGLTAVAGASVFVLAPLVINALILIRHERDLDNSTPSQAALLHVTYRPRKVA